MYENILKYSEIFLTSLQRPSCVELCVIVHGTSILRGIMCYCAWHVHLAWNYVLLCVARPSCVELYVIVRGTSILRGIMCYCALRVHLAWNFVLCAAPPSCVEFYVMDSMLPVRERFGQSLVLREA